MDTPKNNIEALFANVGEYVENKTELWKLKAIDKASDVVASLAEKIIVYFLAGIFFVLFSIGLALLIGYWLGQNFWGFFILAGVYGIAGFIIHVSRNKLIKSPITNGIIQKFLN